MIHTDCTIKSCYRKGFAGFLLGILLFVLSGGVSFAQSAESPSEVVPLTVDEAVAYALEHNADFQRSGITLRMAELNFDYNAAIFDPTFQAELNTSRTATGGLSDQSQLLSGNDTRTINSKLGYSWLFPTGDAIKFSLGGDRSSYSTLLDDTPANFKSYSSVLALAYSRPLLRGFGSAVTMAGIDRATIDVAISKTAVESAKAELIYGVRMAYLRAVAAREAEGVAQVSLTEAQNLFSETKAKVEAGALAPYQEIAAEAGLYTREEDLLRAQGEYEKAINSLRELLGAAPELKINISPGMDIAFPRTDEETAVDKAFQARPDIGELKLRRNRAEVDLRLASDSLKPELGFTSGLGFQGENTDYFGSLKEMNNFSWNAGLLYTVPLGGNSAAKAKMQSAELAIEDIKLQLQALGERVRREVTDALVELGNANERLRVSKTGLEAARVKMDAEKQRFELGLITAGDLLEYEKEYSQAQLAEVQARIELLQAEALLAKLTNSG